MNKDIIKSHMNDLRNHLHMKAESLEITIVLLSNDIDENTFVLQEIQNILPVVLFDEIPSHKNINQKKALLINRASQFISAVENIHPLTTPFVICDYQFLTFLHSKKINIGAVFSVESMRGQEVQYGAL